MTSGEEKTTVLHLSTSHGPGGAERMISTLTAALNQGQFRIIVGLTRPGWLQAECEALGVKTFVIPLAGRFSLQWFRACLRLLREERVDEAFETGRLLGRQHARDSHVPRNRCAQRGFERCRQQAPPASLSQPG